MKIVGSCKVSGVKVLQTSIANCKVGVIRTKGVVAHVGAPKYIKAVAKKRYGVKASF